MEIRARHHRRQSLHLKRMLDDLLDVGRAVSGKISLDLESLDFDAIVRGALDMLATAGRTRARRIDYQGASSWVRGDRTRLEQIVSNLVANAVDHSATDGLIELRLARDGDRARLTVRDYGAGLDAETASRVFELFYQASQPMQRPKGGLGIGLTLVRRIAELHGGRADVYSAGPGKGTTFTVVLPAIGRETRRSQATAAPAAASALRAARARPHDPVQFGDTTALSDAGITPA